MNRNCALDRNSLAQADTVSSIPFLIDIDMLRESISMMKNGKTAGPSGLGSEMVKVAGQAGVDMITGLVNQIIVGAIPTE